jgi:hypothetical protein
MMRGAKTNREALRRYARFALVASGCLRGFRAAAGALAALRSSPARAESRVTLKQVDWGALSASVIERKLDHWLPTKENAQVPRASIRSPQTDISGVWEVHRGHDGSSLAITRSGPETYDVVLDTHGCLDWWKLRRTGHYSAGVLVLNRPVQEYFPLTYQKLYAVRTSSSEYLVPDAGIGKFEQGCWPDGSFSFKNLEATWYVFCRTPPPTPGPSERNPAPSRPGKPQ